jgi:hypothetical protein
MFPRRTRWPRVNTDDRESGNHLGGLHWGLLAAI